MYQGHLKELHPHEVGKEKAINTSHGWKMEGNSNNLLAFQLEEHGAVGYYELVFLLDNDRMEIVSQSQESPDDRLILVKLKSEHYRATRIVDVDVLVHTLIDQWNLELIHDLVSPFQKQLFLSHYDHISRFI